MTDGLRHFIGGFFAGFGFGVLFSKASSLDIKDWSDLILTIAAWSLWGVVFGCAVWGLWP